MFLALWPTPQVKYLKMPALFLVKKNVETSHQISLQKLLQKAF